jgi:predicted ATPase
VIRTLGVRDLRSVHDLRLELGPVSALVGEGRAGTSSILLALRALLHPLGGVLAAGDVREGSRALEIHATLSDGAALTLAGAAAGAAPARRPCRPTRHARPGRR